MFQWVVEMAYSIKTFAQIKQLITQEIRKLRVNRTPHPQTETTVENPLDFQDFFLKSQVITLLIQIKMKTLFYG